MITSIMKPTTIMIMMRMPMSSTTAAQQRQQVQSLDLAVSPTALVMAADGAHSLLLL